MRTFFQVRPRPVTKKTTAPALDDSAEAVFLKNTLSESVLQAVYSPAGRQLYPVPRLVFCLTAENYMDYHGRKHESRSIQIEIDERSIFGKELKAF